MGERSQVCNRERGEGEGGREDGQRGTAGRYMPPAIWAVGQERERVRSVRPTRWPRAV